MRLAFLFLFISNFFLAQELQQYFTKLQVARTDTQKINLLNAITEFYLYENEDSAKAYNQKSIECSVQENIEKFNFRGYYCKAILKRMDKNYEEAIEVANKAREVARLSKNGTDEAEALILRGSIYESMNNGKLALEDYLGALEVSKLNNALDAIVSSCISLGLYFKKNNEPTNALFYFLEALKRVESLNDTSSYFTICINLGTLYERTKDNQKALGFYKKALAINEKDADENGKAICYFKIGRLYKTLGKNDSANYYLKETMKIHLKRKDEVGLIFDYSFLSTLYQDEGKFDHAERELFHALDLALKHGDSIRINLVYTYLATLNQRQNKYREALDYFKKGLEYKGLSIPKETVMMIYQNMSELYKKLGVYKEAYEYYVLYKAWSDSAYSISDTKKQTELKMGYEFDKVQEKLKAEAERKELLNKAELEKERQRRYFLLIGLGLISLFLVMAVRSYQMKKKANYVLQIQKQEIERQKKIVDAKNLEISDSINYAHRIQTASLPEKTELDAYFSNYSLFFRPKDVVSGDFYWAAGTDDKVMIAVADCTGHGVPGAITSMIGSMLLNEIFYVKKLVKPNEILTELNRLVKLTLRQEAHSLSKDGMDVAFCTLDKRTNQLLYAGANRPIYVISPEQGVTEYKATKMSIGGYVPLIQDYELVTISLNKGDTVVLSSDGYADQFGGKKEKKFTSKSFKEMMEQMAGSDPFEQKRILETRFDEWKGKYEQTDDVLVFVLNV